MKFSCIEITPGVRKVLNDLQGGEHIAVTFRQEGDPDPTYTITGGGKHRSDVIGAALEALKNAGLVQEVDKGLFEGCGQTFVVVR